jgi:integrase/recombinase XerD
MKGMSDHTIGEHKRFLFGALSHSKIVNKKIQDLKLTDVASVIEAGRAHGEYGSQRAVVTYRQYLKYLQESGVKLPFDWRDIEVPKVPEKERISYNEKELKRIFKAVMKKGTARKFARYRMRALLETIFASGMRISEALTLTKKQFKEFSRTHETIIKGKGGEERAVYFTSRAIKWIKEYLKIRKDYCEALFVNESGKPLKMVTAKSDLLRHRDEWGLDKIVRFHAFRRTLATFLIEKGANPKETQHILGHKSERTTLRYYVALDRKKAKNTHQRLLNGI